MTIETQLMRRLYDTCTQAEAARALGVTRGRITQLLDRGSLARIDVDGKVKVDVKSVLTLLEWRKTQKEWTESTRIPGRMPR